MKFLKMILAAIALLSGFAVNAKPKHAVKCDANIASQVAAQNISLAIKDYGATQVIIDDMLEDAEKFYVLFTMVDAVREVKNVPYTGYVRVEKKECAYTGGAWGSGGSRIFIPKNAVSLMHNN